MLQPASQSGVKSSVESVASASSAEGDNNYYLPDFDSPAAVAVLVVISQIVAVILSLARNPMGEFYLVDLARISALMLWLTLSCALVLTLARPILVRFSVVTSSLYSLGLILVSTALVSEAIFWLGNYALDPTLVSIAAVFPRDHWEFLYRNLFIGGLVGVIVLRYFYVIDQWRRNVRLEAESRYTALQARIRPHFLFNSMNTIAALTRRDPAAAEQAIEDLADLFRASLGKPGEPISMEQELEIARVYQRMEEQRLGDRLKVDWNMHDVPMDSRVPGLTIQPLLENAIYHGIEPLADGGLIRVEGAADDGMITISISNPLAPAHQRPAGHGHRLALDNIRQRLELVYGERARLEVESLADQFRVLIGFPAAV